MLKTVYKQRNSGEGPLENLWGRGEGGGGGGKKKNAQGNLLGGWGGGRSTKKKIAQGNIK